MNNNQGSPFSGTLFLKTVALSGITSTGATTFSAAATGTAAQLEYAIKGKAYGKANISGGTTPTTDAVTGNAFAALTANKGAVFVLGLDASANIKAVQGPVVGCDDAGTFQLAPEFPVVPETIAPFAYVVVKTDSTASAWTFGSSNWNATGVTATPVAVVMLPGRPQVS